MFSLWQEWSLLKTLSSILDKENYGRQAPPSVLGSRAPKQNWFYALQIRHDQEGYPINVVGTLKVYYVDVYALLDPGATLSL